MITEFQIFEKNYLHYTIHNQDNFIDLIKLFDISDYSENNIKKINSWFFQKRKSADTIVRLYHGTSPKYDISNQGLFTTSISRKHSYQSESGYVYLSIYPQQAKTFGNVGCGINNAVVYEVYVPVEWLKPDTDQLRNMRLYGSPDCGNSMADSLLYGDGFRVKGNIPPYAIKKWNN